jgi:hypothetical protein
MRILPIIPAYPDTKPDKVKWPTARFAEADAEEAADSIVKSRKKKRKRKGR